MTDSQTTLDEMESLIRELRVLDEDISIGAGEAANLRERERVMSTDIADQRKRRADALKRLLELATWINT